MPRAAVLPDTDLPGAMARARYVRITPMKARRAIDMVRGMRAEDALAVLQFAPQSASEQVRKVVASAVANAENNDRLDRDDLVVTEAYVDEGPTLKRFRPRAQGRAYRIRKRTCHITVVVTAQPRSDKPAKKASRLKKATAKVTKAGAAKATATKAGGTETSPSKAAKAAKVAEPAKSTKAAKAAEPAKATKATKATKASSETSTAKTSTAKTSTAKTSTAKTSTAKTSTAKASAADEDASGTAKRRAR